MSGASDSFKILVTGDFSGRFSRNPAAPKLTPRLIDRDNFDDVLKEMNVSVEVQGRQLFFHEFEDFHPDRIYEALGSFADLDAHASMGVHSAPADLLSAIISEQGGDDDDDEQDTPVTLRDVEDLPGFVERVTAGHLVPVKDAAQLKRESDRQLSATERMRTILHHPEFQSVEAAWRSLYLLVREIDTGEDLKIYLLDLTLPELVQHAEALRESLKKAGPWAVVLGNFAFGQSDAEVGALRKIARLSSSLGAPFLAEAVPSESGASTKAWAEFRKTPSATWIGLALPRFLLRLPYGEKTNPIDNFPFEEMPTSNHADYLWGNPAFLCVLLLAQAFESSGWDMETIPRRFDGLPLHIYYEDGEAVAKPCAEVLLSQSDAEYLMESGVMPLITLKGQDAVVVGRFQSVADPLKSLPRF
jgi:predicted component of type VI protein secretion system